MTRPRRGARGMTLLEVLLASAILAGFFAMVYAIVAATLERRSAIEESALPYAIGPVVMERVTRDLESACIEPYKEFDAFHAEADSVNGETTTRVDFVTTVRSRSRVKIGDEWVKASVNEVGYRCRRSETAQGLMALYRREDLGVDDEPHSGGRYFKLADRVKTFRIDWFAEDPGDPKDDESKGEEEWDAKKEKRLPWGCRVTLVVAGDVELDERGRPISDATEYHFVTYVAFPSRFDKADQPQKP